MTEEKEKVWKKQLHALADNPEYYKQPIASIENELQNRDTPDVDYLRDKIKSLSKFIDDVELGQKKFGRSPPPETVPKKRTTMKKTKKKPAFGSVAWQNEQAKKIRAKQKMNQPLSGADRAFVTTQLMHNFNISEKSAMKMVNKVYPVKKRRVR